MAMPDSGRHAPCSMPHAHFLVGPTASGKSAVAHHLAERAGSLIVSADSMNIYRGMDIGTAKPSAAERQEVQYAGVDVAEPTDKFSVAQYLAEVKPALNSGREAIVAGGTGLYVKCLTEGFDDVPPENSELRRELEGLNVETLQQRAQESAAGLYAGLTEDDRRNPRRLIRILEKSGGAGIPACPSPAEKGHCASDHQPSAGSWNSIPKPVLVGLHVEREVLHRQIEERVVKMYAAGLLEEARGLMDLKLSETARQAIGYAEAFAVLRNEMTLDEAREKTVIRTRQLAKRQMTWFRNQLSVHWIETAEYPDMEKRAEAVSNAWKKIGATPVNL